MPSSTSFSSNSSVQPITPEDDVDDADLSNGLAHVKMTRLDALADAAVHECNMPELLARLDTTQGEYACPHTPFSDASSDFGSDIELLPAP